MIEDTVLGGLTVMCVAAVWYDLRVRRIPNGVTGIGLLLALALRATGGWSYVAAGAAGAAAALALSLPLFAVGALGGGDAKLLTAAGAFLGLGRLLPALLVTAVAGGILAAVVVSRRRRWSETGARLRHLWSGLGRDDGGPRREVHDSGSADPPPATTVPYGLAIAVGSMVGWFL